MKIQTVTSLLAAFYVAAFFATPTYAIVTNVAWYRLGENDPGAASGQVVNSTTMDFGGEESQAIRQRALHQ